MGQQNSLRYLIVGGDERMLELANIFKLNSYDISILGFDSLGINNVSSYDDIKTAVINADIIVGPIPFMSSESNINTKYSSKNIDVMSLVESMKEEKILFAGAINSKTREILNNNNIRYIDYNEDESFQIMNAVITAEATLAILINETDKAIFNSNIMILGYGRIGKILCSYLKAIGANVYAEARNEADLTWIKANKFNPISLLDLDKQISSMNIIVNTIPSLILNKDTLELVQKDALVVDLASKPGGADFDFCKSIGIKAIHALGLPGKSACKTASEVIFDTISRRLNNI